MAIAGSEVMAIAGSEVMVIRQRPGSESTLLSTIFPSHGETGRDSQYRPNARAVEPFETLLK
jgi:hypothetical protein